jgi:hypothetical protein
MGGSAFILDDIGIHLLCTTEPRMSRSLPNLSPICHFRHCSMFPHSFMGGSMPEAGGFGTGTRWPVK